MHLNGFSLFSNMAKWDMKNSDDKMASFYTLGEKEVCSEYRVDIIIVLAHKKNGQITLKPISIVEIVWY